MKIKLKANDLTVILERTYQFPKELVLELRGGYLYELQEREGVHHSS
jgi:hypothetical protein